MALHEWLIYDYASCVISFSNITCAKKSEVLTSLSYNLQIPAEWMQYASTKPCTDLPDLNVIAQEITMFALLFSVHGKYKIQTQMTPAANAIYCGLEGKPYNSPWLHPFRFLPIHHLVILLFEVWSSKMRKVLLTQSRNTQFLHVINTA